MGDLTYWAHIWCVSGFVHKTGCYMELSETISPANVYIVPLRCARTTHYLSSPLQKAIYLGLEQELSALNAIRHMLCCLGAAWNINSIPYCSQTILLYILLWLLLHYCALIKSYRIYQWNYKAGHRYSFPHSFCCLETISTLPCLITPYGLCQMHGHIFISHPLKV
jgi:hypothetical protein